MKKLFTTACIGLMSILTTPLFSQSQDDMKKWTEYMTPGEMHKWLAKSDGTWNEDVSIWTTPGAPTMKMSANCENKMIMNGLFQSSTATGTYNGMPFQGHGIIGYDNEKKVFQSTWIDNLGSGTMFLEGSYDPATKIITLKGKMTEVSSGQDAMIKETIQFPDDNTQIQNT